MILSSAVDCPECVRLLTETNRRKEIYMLAIDRLCISSFNRISHISWVVNAADEARIDLTLAALELERHQEIHRDAVPIAA
jgi:hypothetical protein